MSVNPKITPYYLLNLENVKANFLSFQNSIRSIGRNDIIAYSVKANYNPAIIELLNELGSFFEVCSDYEYELMKKQGISASRIIVNGCFYKDFSKYKGSILIIDTYDQLLEWIKNGSKVKIGIRVNLDFITGDDRFHNKKSRFGLEIQRGEVKSSLKQIDTKNIICLHCHISGNNREPSIYRDIIMQLEKICQDINLHSVKYFDIGGGYKIGSKNGFWSFDDYVGEVGAVCTKDIQIIFEPGNSLVRNCAEYHTKVIAVKKNGTDNIFVVDGSTLHIPKTNIQTADFRFECGNNPLKYSGQRIYGNTCKESDLLFTLTGKEKIAIGDQLVIENIGAYSLNEINPLILGMPKVYLKMSEKILIGNHIFDFVCQYSECYKSIGNNDYTVIKQRKLGRGLYAFVRNGAILYIGAAYNQNISDRVAQHFRKDSGGLRNKLSKEQIKELEESSLYACRLEVSKQHLLFEESLVIGLHRPKFNYL